jgi:hypothetical protein
VRVIAASLSLLAGSAFALPIIPGENPNLPGMSNFAGSGRHLSTPETNVCIVNTLTDNGENQNNGVGDDTDFSDNIGSGDFRYCLRNAPKPTTIVFEVGGYIELNHSTVVSDDYITIAGQTAPYPGITFKDRPIFHFWRRS